MVENLRAEVTRKGLQDYNGLALNYILELNKCDQLI